jgi:hypothetical protein
VRTEIEAAIAYVDENFSLPLFDSGLTHESHLANNVSDACVRACA